jgi:hypothetical protein
MKQSRREAQEPEPIKIRGNLVLLKEAVAVAGLNGEWLERPNGVWRYRCDDRAGLNWSGHQTHRVVRWSPCSSGKTLAGYSGCGAERSWWAVSLKSIPDDKEGRTSRFSGWVK